MNKKGRVKAISLMGAIGAMCLTGGFFAGAAFFATAETNVASDSILTAGAKTTIASGTTRPREWYFYEKEGYDTQSGIYVSSAENSGSVSITKDVDLSVFNKEDSLVKCIPDDDNVSSISVKLSDSKQSDNYVLFNWMSNKSVTYISEDGTTYLGSDLVISYKVGSELVSTKPVYEYLLSVVYRQTACSPEQR